jgi:hypothetical protein
MGDFIFHFEQNPIFLYQISWDCPLEDGESDAAEARCRAHEAGGDDLRAEADSLEYLRPLVGLQGGDAHLSHHLNTQDTMELHNMQCCGSGIRCLFLNPGIRDG